MLECFVFHQFNEILFLRASIVCLKRLFFFFSLLLLLSCQFLETFQLVFKLTELYFLRLAQLLLLVVSFFCCLKLLPHFFKSFLKLFLRLYFLNKTTLLFDFVLYFDRVELIITVSSLHLLIKLIRLPHHICMHTVNHLP